MDLAAPRTSFVIATRDRADELSGTLVRLLQTTRCPMVVVDNDSRDASRDVTISVAQSHPQGRRIKLVALRRNRGAVARNVGVAACDTPFVAFCDDDSWWQPDATRIGAELFDRHPSVALLAAQTVVWPQGRRDPFCEQLANSALGHAPGLPGPSVLGFQSCSAMVRRSAFLAVGGFSAVLHFRGEEQLLALDLAAAGWDLCYCPNLVAFHRPSPRRATPPVQRARVLRNDFLTSCMRRPPRACVSTSGELLRAAVRDAAHAKAAAEALIRLPAALRNRRRLAPELERKVRLLEAAAQPD
ncbi:glycosyltransferase family 2 protein [Mycobacterium sp.]|uniref:glycosyltransferase family 2 protein n=1 Tax=Mycobacterium sp. TaxID=1785 RepID=UPI002D75AF22|nr:glycosyltransferase family 2 protein [Mycobacterium sp.]HZA12027.1 glycosyltransferase family 2 protein [Mycobacterium sp.]